MPLVADRVKETTATTGTGTVTLAGASAGFRAFSSAFSENDVVYYCLVSGSLWEVGYGTFKVSNNTLARDTVLSSSAGGTTKITLAGTSDVFCTAPSETISTNAFTLLML